MRGPVSINNEALVRPVFIIINCITRGPFSRGPKGPYVAHLRKRSRVKVKPFTEDH